MRKANKRVLNEMFVKSATPKEKRTLIWDINQRGLVLSVEPTGRRTYKVIYTFGGKPRWYTIGDATVVDLKEARRRARVLMGHVADGVDPQAERTKARKAGTFQELAERYVDEYAKVHNRSWKQADNLIRRYFYPALAQRRVTEITRGDIRTIHRQLTNAGKGSLANQAIIAASAVFNWAIGEEVVDLAGNPAKGIRMNPGPKEGRAYTDDEMAALWAAFEKADHMSEAVLKLMALTGQRKDEVRTMRWEHISEDHNWWTQPGTLEHPNKATRIGKPVRPHRVFLCETAQAILEELIPDTDGWLFPSPVKPDAPAGSVNKGTRVVKEETGIDDFRPHGLRHTVATGLSALKIPPHHVSRVLNHSEGGTTTRYNHHAYDAEKQRALETWEAHLLALVQGREVVGNVVSMQTRK